MATWEVSAQVEGGRRLVDQVDAPAEATERRVLMTFLGRHLKDRSRLQYWYERNLNGYYYARLLKDKQLTTDQELPDPSQDMPLNQDYSEWPSMLRCRPGS